MELEIPRDGTAEDPILARHEAWTFAVKQLGLGGREVVLSLDTAHSIGMVGISLIARQMENYIQARTSVTLDPAHGSVRFLQSPSENPTTYAPQAASAANSALSKNMDELPTANLPSTLNSSPSYASPTLADRAANNSKAKVAKSRIEKIPRPPNAFILYRQVHHHQIKAQNPETKNIDMSKIIGEMWRNESDEIREVYKQMALDEKNLHRAKYPSYQYQPRKQDEKKRRRKAAAAEQAGQILSGVSDLSGFADSFARKPLDQLPLPTNTTPQQSNGSYTTLTLTDENESAFLAQIEEYNKQAGLISPSQHELHQQTFTADWSNETQRDIFFVDALLPTNAVNELEKTTKEMKQKYPEAFSTESSLEGYYGVKGANSGEDGQNLDYEPYLTCDYEPTNTSTPTFPDQQDETTAFSELSLQPFDDPSFWACTGEDDMNALIDWDECN